MNTTREATRLYLSGRTSDNTVSAPDTADFSEARRRVSLEVRERA